MIEGMEQSSRSTIAIREHVEREVEGLRDLLEVCRDERETAMLQGSLRALRAMLHDMAPPKPPRAAHDEEQIPGGAGY